MNIKNLWKHHIDIYGFICQAFQNLPRITDPLRARACCFPAGKFRRSLPIQAPSRTVSKRTWWSWHTNTLQLLLGFTLQIMCIYMYNIYIYLLWIWSSSNQLQDHQNQYQAISILWWWSPTIIITTSTYDWCPQPWSFVHLTPLRNCLGWFPFGSRSEKVSGVPRNEKADAPQWKPSLCGLFLVY